MSISYTYYVYTSHVVYFFQAYDMHSGREVYLFPLPHARLHTTAACAAVDYYSYYCAYFSTFPPISAVSPGVKQRSRGASPAFCL